jgi:hypothetical protein
MAVDFHDRLHEIVAGTDRPRSSDGAPKRNMYRHLAFDFWRGGKLQPTKKRRGFIKERHTRKPL